MVSWQIPVSALELWKQTWRLLSFQSQEEPGRCRERAGLDNKARGSGTAKKGFYTLSSAEGCLSVSHHERRVLHWWSVQGSCVFSSLEKVENREGRQFSTLCDCPGSQGHRTGASEIRRGYYWFIGKSNRTKQTQSNNLKNQWILPLFLQSDRAEKECLQ